MIFCAHMLLEAVVEPRSCPPLLQLKKVLSSIPEAPLSVECLMNDIDFRSSMTREKFEEMAGPVLDLAKAPVARVGGCFACKTKGRANAKGQVIPWHAQARLSAALFGGQLMWGLHVLPWRPLLAQCKYSLLWNS